MTLSQQSDRTEKCLTVKSFAGLSEAGNWPPDCLCRQRTGDYRCLGGQNAAISKRRWRLEALPRERFGLSGLLLIRPGRRQKRKRANREALRGGQRRPGKEGARSVPRLDRARVLGKGLPREGQARREVRQFSKNRGRLRSRREATGFRRTSSHSWCSQRRKSCSIVSSTEKSSLSV
jgi:hypothetical protein